MRNTKESIVLRKIRGRFDAARLRGTGTIGAPPSGNAFGAFGNLLSAMLPLMIVAIAVVALFAFGQAHNVTHLAALSPLALGGLAVGETADVSKLVGELNTAFVAFRAANDERLAEIEKKGAADPLLNSKVDAANAAISDLEDKIKEIETVQARVAAGGGVMTAETKDEITNAREFYSLVKGERVEQVSVAQVETVRNYRKAFNAWMRRGNSISPDVRNALSEGSSPDGGFWVLPDTSGKIVRMVYETSPMRQIADIQQIGTDALEGQFDNDEIATAGWVSEGGPRQTETATPQVGRWRIEAAELWAMPKTSQKNLDDSMMDVEGWLARKAADKLGRVENAAFVNADGVSKPRGFISYASGVATKQNFGVVEQKKTGVNGGFPVASPGDFLIDMLAALKAPYRDNATWVGTRLTKAAIRKLKDGQGNYLWQRDFTAAGGETPLLGYKFVEFADMPEISAGTASVLALGVGDFKQGYQIVDRFGIRVLRNPFTQMGFVLFYTTTRVGGGVVNGEAIKIGNFHT